MAGYQIREAGPFLRTHQILFHMLSSPIGSLISQPIGIILVQEMLRLSSIHSANSDWTPCGRHCSQYWQRSSEPDVVPVPMG